MHSRPQNSTSRSSTLNILSDAASKPFLMSQIAPVCLPLKMRFSMNAEKFDTFGNSLNTDCTFIAAHRLRLIHRSGVVGQEEKTFGSSAVIQSLLPRKRCLACSASSYILGQVQTAQLRWQQLILSREQPDLFSLSHQLTGNFSS